MGKKLEFGIAVNVFERKPTVTKIAGPSYDPRSFVRIEQVITVSIEVPVYTSGEERCGLCRAEAPLPSAEAGGAVLQWQDSMGGIRPGPESQRADGRYPVKGWSTLPFHGTDVLVCAACRADLLKWMADRRKKPKK